MNTCETLLCQQFKANKKGTCLHVFLFLAMSVSPEPPLKERRMKVKRSLWKPVDGKIDFSYNMFSV